MEFLIEALGIKKKGEKTIPSLAFQDFPVYIYLTVT